MNVVRLEVPLIESNPKNNRKIYQGIEKLAESIALYGLREHLIVLEYEPGKFHVHAGERRLRAIRLLCQQHDESGKLRWEGPVACVVITMYGLEKTPPNPELLSGTYWHLGARYAEDYESNIDQTMIAGRVGKTQSHVSHCLRIHYGLAPKVKQILNHIGPDALSLAQLLQLIKLKTQKTDEPDEALQIERCIEFVGGDRRKVRPAGRARNETRNILERVAALKGKRVPMHAKPYVDKIVAYLKGEQKRLRF